MSEQSKHLHRDQLVQIGIQAVEHALIALSQDDPARKIINERTQALCQGKFEHIAADVQRNRKKKIFQPYTQAGCLLRATEDLLLLAVSETFLSGSALVSVFVPCWDSFSFINNGTTESESNWQNENLYPLIERAFEQARKADKVSTKVSTKVS